MEDERRVWPTVHWLQPVDLTRTAARWLTEWQLAGGKVKRLLTFCDNSKTKIKMNEISPPILVRVLEKIQILGDVTVP